MTDTTQSAPKQAAAAKSPKTPEPTVTTTAQPSAAAQLAAQEFANVVPAMIGAVKLGKRIAYGLVVAVLAATYPHVGMYLDDYIGILGWIFPAIFGVGLLAFYHVAQTPGLIAKGRKRAYAVVVLCGAGEIAMQIAASHSLALRALFVAVVGIGLAAKWAAAGIKPDLAAIAAAETSAAAQAAELAPATPAPTKRGRACAKNCRCGKHNRRKPAAPKVPAAAPVSPAPGGRMIDGLWLPAGVSA